MCVDVREGGVANINYHHTCLCVHRVPRRRGVVWWARPEGREIRVHPSLLAGAWVKHNHRSLKPVYFDVLED